MATSARAARPDVKRHIAVTEKRKNGRGRTRMTASALPAGAAPSRRGRRTVGLPLPPWTIDRAHGEPLYLQLVRHLREMVTTGMLASGQSVPSSRELARTLGVSRMTIVMAYELLTSEGLLEPRAGSGTVVCAGAVTEASKLSASTS